MSLLQSEKWITDDPSELPRAFDEASELSYQMRKELMGWVNPRSLPQQMAGAVDKKVAGVKKRTTPHSLPGIRGVVPGNMAAG